MIDRSDTSPEFTRAASQARALGCLACPVGALLITIAIGYMAAFLRTAGPPIMLLATVGLLAQVGLSVAAVRSGRRARILLPVDPDRKQRLSPVIGIWGGIVGAVLVGGLMVSALTEGWLQSRYWAAHEMGDRSLAGVIEQLGHRELSVRAAALRELDGRKGPGIVPVAARSLDAALDRHEAVTMDWSAAVLRSHHGDTDASDALPVLKRLLTTHPGRLPEGKPNNGWDALAGMATQNAAALDLLLDLAAHEDYPVRRAARGRLVTYAADDAVRAKRWSEALRAKGEAGPALIQRRLCYVILESRHFGPDLDARDVDGWRAPGEPHAWIGASLQATRLTSLAVPDTLQAEVRRNLDPILAAYGEATPEEAVALTRLVTAVAAVDATAATQFVKLGGEAMARQPFGAVVAMLDAYRHAQPAQLRPLIPALVEIIDQPIPDSHGAARAIDARQSGALLVLAHMGPHAAEALLPVAKLLDHPVWCSEAILALESMGNAAAPALPRLRELAAGRDADIARAAKAAITTIEAAK